MGRPFIAIEGVIGVGKTTLARKVADRLGYYLSEEPVETNPYLDLFYQDKARWGAIMQVHLLGARHILHQRAMTWPTGVIQDRSIYGDTVFARNLHESGLITDLEWQTYQLLWESKRSNLVFPDAVIFLWAPIDVIMDRIGQRGRGCEQGGVDRAYLAGLARWYDTLMGELRGATTVVLYDWTDPEQYVDNVADLIRGVDESQGFTWQRRRPTLLP